VEQIKGLRGDCCEGAKKRLQQSPAAKTAKNGFLHNQAKRYRNASFPRVEVSLVPKLII
jgi:hypothetical protein